MQQSFGQFPLVRKHYMMEISSIIEYWELVLNFKNRNYANCCSFVNVIMTETVRNDGMQCMTLPYNDVKNKAHFCFKA